jgi:phage baseplate assembly protein W
MVQYIGFSTADACKARTTNQNSGIGGGPGTIANPIIVGKKYRLTDVNLVVRDFFNALNIRQGEKVGQPDYGSRIWNFLFDPNTQDITFEIENEVRRIAGLDPRLALNFIKTYPQDNGLLIEVQITVLPFNQSALLNVFFNTNTNTATIQS